MQYGVLKMDNQKNKVRKNIYIDKDVWDLLEYKLPCSRSSFFEKKAREYFDVSCKGKNALGCNLLGYIYKDSMGVKQDLKLALKYFQIACQLGNNDGCKNQNLLDKKGK